MLWIKQQFDPRTYCAGACPSVCLHPMDAKQSAVANSAFLGNDQSDQKALTVRPVDERVGGAYGGEAGRIENFDRLAVDPDA